MLLGLGRLDSAALCCNDVFDKVRALFPSPSLTRDSIARSRLPPSPFNMLELRLSSGKPMSLRIANFDSMLSPTPLKVASSTLGCLFTPIDEGAGAYSLRPFGDVGGEP